MQKQTHEKVQFAHWEAHANKGWGSAPSFTWQDYNIPLPPPLKNPGYTYENGVLRAYLLGFLQLLANYKSPVAPLLNERTIKVVPVSMAKDALTLKPGFQADPKQLKPILLSTSLRIK